MLRCGQHLGRIDLTLALIYQDHVGECATDVDADSDMLADFHVRTCLGLEQSARLPFKRATSACLAVAKGARRSEAKQLQQMISVSRAVASSNTVFP